MFNYMPSIPALSTVSIILFLCMLLLPSRAHLCFHYFIDKQAQTLFWWDKRLKQTGSQSYGRRAQRHPEDARSGRHQCETNSTRYLEYWNNVSLYAPSDDKPLLRGWWETACLTLPGVKDDMQISTTKKKGNQRKKKTRDHAQNASN